MLAARITCPRCGQELTVTENAPPHVSCPRCLAALVNPASPASGMRPVPVIPLDRQVERDTRWVTYLVYGLLGLLGFAAVATIGMGGGPRAGLYVLLLLGGVATFMYFLGAARAEKEPWTDAPLPVEDSGIPPPPGPAGPTVLQYGVPRGSHRPAVTPGAVAAGFFSAIGVCALGFYILAATSSYNPGGGSRTTNANYHAMILAGVVCMIIVYIVASIRVTRRWRGLGIGATSGLCLGMLALGPCAACYLLTLG